MSTLTQLSSPNTDPTAVTRLLRDDTTGDQLTLRFKPASDSMDDIEAHYEVASSTGHVYASQTEIIAGDGVREFVAVAMLLLRAHK